MEKEKFEFLQYLYKSLKKHDVEILKHFNDSSISDNDYFFYGINSDIISNTLNVLTNYLSGNIESAGVDASCRTIIEAMVILLMDAKGKITDKQKTIYRYLYAYVDFDNFHSLLTDKDKENEGIKRVAADKEKAQQAMMEHFDCTAKDLKDRKIGIDDPCFYLKSSLREDIRFSKLLEIYPIHDEKTIRMYEFFSMFIHPRCEMNPKIEEAIMLVRNIYVDGVLNFVYEYLKDCKLLIDLEEEKAISDFNYDFFYNPLLQNNVHNVKDVEYIFHNLMNQLCKLKDGTDWFTWHFLEKSKYIFIDMMISESMGYKEHVISCFKSFVEQYSVFYAIGSFENLNDFNHVKQAFWCSSRIQIDSHFQNLGWKDGTVPEEEIKKLYDEYFKDKYKLNNYQKFYWNLRRNSLYCLGDEKKSYNKYVRSLLESVFSNEMESKDAMTLYRISKDMSHASGYNFNASEGIVDSYFHKTMLFAWKLLKYFIVNASETLKEHNEECNVGFIITALDMFIMIEEKAICDVFSDIEKIEEGVDGEYGNKVN